MNVDASAAGMDEARLARITDHFERAYMEPGKLAGCQVLVSRYGHVAYQRNFGTLVVGRRPPGHRRQHLADLFDDEADHVGRAR